MGTIFDLTHGYNNSNIASDASNEESFIKRLVGTHFVKPTTDLPPIPIAFSNLAELIARSKVINITKNSNHTIAPSDRSSLSSSDSLDGPHREHQNFTTNPVINKTEPQRIKLSPIEQEQLKLAEMTDTDLSCYIAPPDNTIVDMDKLMGFWYMVKKQNNSQGTNARYSCEQVIYTKTGPNTFDKVADVHFKHQWITIKGNGTFIKPGIIIIDWKILSKPTKPNRLVYTILGTDYHQYVVGYNCRTGHNRPEIILQTRHRQVPKLYLEKAFATITQNNLPLNDMACQEGFGPPRIAKPPTNQTNATQQQSPTPPPEIATTLQSPPTPSPTLPPLLQSPPSPAPPQISVHSTPPPTLPPQLESPPTPSPLAQPLINPTPPPTPPPQSQNSPPPKNPQMSPPKLPPTSPSPSQQQTDTSKTKSDDDDDSNGTDDSDA